MDDFSVPWTSVNVVLLVVGVIIVSGCKDNRSNQEIVSADDKTIYHEHENANTDDFRYIDGINFSSKSDVDVTKSNEQPPMVSAVQPTPPVTKVQIDAQAVQNARMIQENLTNTYAMKAAAYKDVCPKMVVKNVDSDKIVRHGELLRDKHCDYYIYLNKGQIMDVSSNESALSRQLITPVVYDFANGSYLVKTADKYVIRVKSTDIQKLHKPINYDIVITLHNTNTLQNNVY